MQLLNFSLKIRYKYLKTIFILVFLIIIICPFFLLNSTITIPKIKVFEKRKLTIKPDFNLSNIDVFSKNYEAYINDKLPLRTQFIASYMRIWELYLSSFVRRSIKGRSDHYFVKSELSYYLGLNPIPDQKLYYYRTIMAGRQAFWQSQGVEYFFILLPDKSTLYPEYLPQWIKLKKKP